MVYDCTDMAPSRQPNLFITYSSPSEFRNQRNRQAVSSFASRSYHLTSKKITLDRNNYRPFTLSQHGPASPSLAPETKVKQKSPPNRNRASASPTSPQGLILPRSSQPLDERALGSPLADPFTTYPISFKPYVPFLIDYCKCKSLIRSSGSNMYGLSRRAPALSCHARAKQYLRGGVHAHAKS